jgi:hypothetical protein
VFGLLGLSKGNHEGWTSPLILGFGAIALFSFVFFLVVESVVPAPIMDLGLFRHGQFTAAMLVTAVRSVALFGGVFLLPLFLQTHMGLGEVETGELLLPGALVIAFVMPLAARLSGRFGPRWPVVVGLLLTGMFLWMYRALDPNTSTWGVLAPTLVRGVGLGLLVTPVMTAAINAVPTPKAGMASSMLNLVQQVAGSVGIATLATVLGHRTVFHVGLVGEAMRPDSAGWHAAVGGLGARLLELGVSPSDATVLAAATAGRSAAAAASVAAFDDAFLVGAAVVLLGVLPALFLGRVTGRHAPASTAEALAE